MFLKAAASLCIGFLFLGVRSQRIWGSSDYSPGFSNSWGSNSGFSSNSFGNGNSGGLWESNNEGRPNVQLPSSKENWGIGTYQPSGWNMNRPGKPNTGNWQTETSKRPNEKKSSSVVNVPDSWSANSNGFLSEDEDNNVAWGSKPFSGQSGSGGNPKPGSWFSNNINKPSGNDILTESDAEGNSWGANKKKKFESTNGGSFVNSETTTQKNKKNPGSKWETSNNSKKQQKPAGSSNSWNSNDRQENPTNGNAQNEKKQSPLDTSILDELDKNEWYFGKESDYPKPPFRSTLDIDVSELWNSERNRKPPSQQQSNSNNNNNNNRGNNNNNRGSNNNKRVNGNYNRGSNNNRRNRGTDKVERIQCECVNVNLCEEEDMIVTQEDIQFDLRPLEEFRCEKLTDVCCTNPKPKLSSRTNFNQERLWCGQKRTEENPFGELDDSIAAPGEFPWNLRLENAETNCSASLIHHKLALTAAHCVTGAQPDELTLKAGTWNSNDEPSQRRKIMKIIPHPNYNSRNPRNDIAFLILETPFELTDNVNTICLPVTNDKWDSNECVVAGWNLLEIRGQVLEVLEKGIVNFLPQPECQNIMLVTDLWRNYILHDSFVCGLEKTGRKSCTGDEGGFVACPSKKRPDTYLQIGIVSKGMNCDAFGRPGIFTNVLPFLDWINKNYFELGLFDDIDIRSLSV